MNYKAKVLFLLALIYLVSNINNSLASPTYYDKSLSGSQSLTVETASKPKIEGNTGELKYEYKIQIPEGRNGMKPEISINYSSEDSNNMSALGYGFTLNTPSIQVNNKTGIVNMYLEDNYLSNLYGELVKSTSTPNTYLVKKNDSTLSTYSKTPNSWEVTNSDGVKYLYGNTPESRVENASNTSEVYTWYITEISDIFGNNINYNYVKEGGQVYLNSIKYTNIGNNQGIYEVMFNYESRLDSVESYKSGFRVYNAKRLSSVDVNVLGSKIKSYKLSYMTGVNGARSLIAGITESSFENGTLSKSLPETTFGYSRNVSEVKNVTIPEFDRITDINSDGLVDFVLSRRTDTSPYGDYNMNKVVYINNGDMTFTKNELVNMNSTNNSQVSNPPKVPDTELPVIFSQRYYQGGLDPQGNFIADIDGDGNVDILNAYMSYKGNQSKIITNLSTSTIIVGTTTQIISQISTSNISATSTLFFTSDNVNKIGIHTRSIEIINKNGDLKPDLIENTNNTLESSALIYVDINGDSLDDKVKVYSTWYQAQPRTEYKSIWINNGRDYILLDATSSLKYKLPRSYENQSWQTMTSNIIYADINYDGLVDAYNGSNNNYVNNGAGVTSSFEYGNNYLPQTPNSFAADLNGDGLSDIAINTNSGSGYEYTVTLSKMKSDLLNNIKNTNGGETTIEYAPATSYLNDKGERANKISYPIWTVKKEIVSDGSGNISETKYNYEDAYISRLPNYDNTLTGFGKVTSISPNGHKKVSYYHQGNDNKDDEIGDSINKIGRLYKEEIYNNSNLLEKKTQVEYAERANPLSPNLTSVIPVAKISLNIDNNNSIYYTQATRQEYDSNLNLIKEINYGDVLGTSTLNFADINASDTKTVETKYTNSALYNKKFLPVSKVVKGINGNIFGLEEYLYDNNISTSTQLNFTKGLITEKRSYSSTSNNPLKEKYSWDTNYGLLTSSQDARGATTTYSYDSYKLQATQNTNALGHKEFNIPNYKVSKPSTIMDANGLVIKNDYDNFGRLLRTFKNNNLLEERIYTDSYLPEVKVVKYISATDTVISVSYYDGLGKIVKEKVENANGTYTTLDYKYDNMGNLIRESLPYEASMLGRYDNVTLPSYYYKYYTRDIYGRVLESKTAISTDTVQYGARDKRVIDSNKHETYYKYDKDNNIIRVEENNEGAKYLTNYTYDINNNLINILDAENGVRNISYDWLGRKIGDELTHDRGSISIATNTTKYGDNNEYLQAFFADGSETKTNFDILGRKKSVTSGSKVLSEYTYDVCSYGKGRLCVASSSDGVVKRFTYDIRGNLTSESSEIFNNFWSPNSMSYYAYDIASNLISESDGYSTTTNSYSKNFLTNINYKDNSYLNGLNVLTNVKYNQSGQVLSYERGSLKQINSYDDKNLFRISNFSLMRYGTSSYQYKSVLPTLIPVSTSTVTNAIRTRTYPEYIQYQLVRSSEGQVVSYSRQKGSGVEISATRGSSSASSSDSIEHLVLYKDSNLNNVSSGTLDFNASNLKFDMVDSNAYLQVFKRSTSPWSQPLNDYMDCATSTPLSDKLMLSSISTSTILSFKLNNNFNNVYNSYPMYTMMSYCVMEGHTVNNVKSIISTSTKTNKINLLSYSLNVNYPKPNNKPIINTLSAKIGSQGLMPVINYSITDQDSDNIIEQELYIKLGSATGTVYTLASGTPTASLNNNYSYTPDNYKFEYNTSYNVIARVRDSAGDWSSFATTTYNAGVKNSTSTNVVKCAGFSLTDLGSINCPDPEYNIKIDVTYIPALYPNYPVIPQGWGYSLRAATITVATSTNIASSTIGYLYNDKSGGTDLGSNGGTGVVYNFKNSDYIGERLTPGTKYYYKIRASINSSPDPFVDSPVYVFTTGDWRTAQNSSYSYDSLSRIRSVLRDEDNSYDKLIYSYDELSRLRGVDKSVSKYGTSTSILESYSYTPTGKILTFNGSPYSYSLNLSHAPTKISSDTISYDKRGRLTSSTLIGNISWDSLSRVKSITKSNGQTSRYYYDAEGNRALTLNFSSPTSSTSTVVSKLFTPNSRVESTGTTTSYSILLNSKPILNIDRSTLKLTSTSTTSIHTLITNHLNSIEKVLDYNTGSIISTSTYTSYGSLNKVGDTNSKRGYTNHIQDTSNLIYANARYLQSNYGVFISSDENTTLITSKTTNLLENPQDLNSYSYVRNNPVHYTDPTGKCIWDMCIVEATLAVAGGAYLGTQLGLGNEVSGWDYLGAVPLAGVGGKIAQATDLGKYTSKIAEGTSLFRADSRSMAEIVKDGGFLSKGANLDMVKHISTASGDSAFISTSRELDVALTHSLKHRGTSFIYEVSAPSNARMIDYDKLGKSISGYLPSVLYRSEKEVVVPFKININNVKNVFQVNSGKIIQNKIK
jgi:RHS repeat-associated protein